MKKVLRYAALFLVAFLSSAALVIILELLFTSAIDVGQVLTISFGTSLCYSILALPRLIKKEAAAKK